jgi:hypothetical protein
MKRILFPLELLYLVCSIFINQQQQAVLFLGLLFLKISVAEGLHTGTWLLLFQMGDSWLLKMVGVLLYGLMHVSYPTTEAEMWRL